MTVITRFAPSPTGHLHIGGARTAAFCWFLARHFGGKFLLRIEDTDLERSRQEYTDSILASMSWLGLQPDEPPVYQSQRFDLYNQYIDKLLESGHAYWCECSAEEVEAMREKARAEGKKPRYDGRCRHRNLSAGAGRVVRLAAPTTGRIVFDDLFKGHIAFDVEELDDMVLRKADGSPTYNMAVVVDDIVMNITHVLRGDDHVNNTPKQILIYNALNAPLPIFAHVPMITGADRQKLSKRHGAKAVIEYEKDGFLAEGLLNYLVRLGWSHGDQEIFTLDEIIQYFDGTNLNAAASCFDSEKLAWVNAQHLRAKSPEELLPLVLPFLNGRGVSDFSEESAVRLISLLQPRVSTLVELAEQMQSMLVSADKVAYDAGAVAKVLNGEGRRHVQALSALLEPLPVFDAETIHDVVNGYVTENALKFKAVGPALRVALLGFQGGPDLSAVMSVMGKEKVVARLQRALTLS